MIGFINYYVSFYKYLITFFDYSTAHFPENHETYLGIDEQKSVLPKFPFYWFSVRDSDLIPTEFDSHITVFVNKKLFNFKSLLRFYKTVFTRALWAIGEI